MFLNTHPLLLWRNFFWLYSESQEFVQKPYKAIEKNYKNIEQKFPPNKRCSQITSFQKGRIANIEKSKGKKNYRYEVYHYFSHFFGFSNITAELLILQENFCLLKSRSHREASFPFFESFGPTIFSRVITKNI